MVERSLQKKYNKIKLSTGNDIVEKSGHVLIDKIYREMFRKLWIYAKIQLEDESLAEEAVQETFRIACEKPDSVINSDNPNGWIMNTLKYTIRGIKRDRTYLH